MGGTDFQGRLITAKGQTYVIIVHRQVGCMGAHWRAESSHLKGRLISSLQTERHTLWEVLTFRADLSQLKGKLISSMQTERQSLCGAEGEGTQQAAHKSPRRRSDQDENHARLPQSQDQDQHRGELLPGFPA